MMPMWAVTIVSVLSGPISNLISKGLAMASASFVTWQIAHGVPATDAGNISAEIVAVVSSILSVLAGTQGVKINSVNAANNGVKVVSADAAAPKVNSPLH